MVDVTSHRLLCVDDSGTARALLLLAFSGWTHVEVVATPEEALTRAQRMAALRTPFQAFVLDIEMDPIDGFTLAGQLRAIGSYADTPIFFFTGSEPNLGQRQLAANTGGTIFVKTIRTTRNMVMAIELALLRAADST